LHKCKGEGNYVPAQRDFSQQNFSVLDLVLHQRDFSIYDSVLRQ